MFVVRCLLLLVVRWSLLLLVVGRCLSYDGCRLSLLLSSCVMFDVVCYFLLVVCCLAVVLMCCLLVVVVC